MSGAQFCIDVRVYLEDTDAGGAVYHTSYLRFMERARSEWLRHLAPRSDASSFVVRALRLRYLSPAKLADSLRICLRLESVGGAHIVLWQGVLRGEEALCDGQVEWASVDQRLRVCRIPVALRDTITVWQAGGMGS